MQRLNSLPDSWRSQGIFLLVILFVTAIDQLSKLWVRNNLYLGQSRPEEGILRLTYTTNDGIIFGLPAPHILTLVIPIVVVITTVFIYYYFRHRHILPDSQLIMTGFGLVIGGSIGNLIDRFDDYEVTDFIDVRLWGEFHWPTFNVADSALVIGIILIIYSLLLLKPFQRKDLGK